MSIRERKPAQARAAEFTLRQVAARKGGLLQAALVEHSSPHDSLTVRHETQAPQREIGELRLAAFEGHMLHRRFGEVRPHELAIQELHPLETAPVRSAFDRSQFRKVIP